MRARFLARSGDARDVADGILLDIGHIIVPVEDMERALAFYRDLLGFKVVGGANPVWTVLSLAAVQITLWKTDERNRIALGPQGEGTPFHHHVRDFEKAADFLESKGLKVKREGPNGGLVWDPFGNVLGLHDHRESPQ